MIEPKKIQDFMFDKKLVLEQIRSIFAAKMKYEIDNKTWSLRPVKPLTKIEEHPFIKKLAGYEKVEDNFVRVLITRLFQWLKQQQFEENNYPFEDSESIYMSSTEIDSMIDVLKSECIKQEDGGPLSIFIGRLGIKDKIE
jgi:hypothetical protein